VRDLVQSIAGEYQRYRKLCEDAVAQLQDTDLDRAIPEGNSVANEMPRSTVANEMPRSTVAGLMRHLAGNLRSRFTDFLSTDGEKPWRDRESEFAAAPIPRAELLAAWAEGWKALDGTLTALSDDDLGKRVTIRGQELSVAEALHRSLAHTGYHVGQIVFLARSFRGTQWRFLSIPPGQSAAYNLDPSMEKAPARMATLQEELADRIERAFSGPTWHGPPLAMLLSDVTPAEAAAHPVPPGHSIAEIIRHCTFWCDDAIVWAESGAGESPEERMDWPPAGKLDGAAWRALVEELASSHRKLAAVTRMLPLTRLTSPAQGRKHTLEDQLRGVVEHGAYHGGQIALLLRAMRGAGKA
jgi:uncharacterized damage-inducible protein DinB